MRHFITQSFYYSIYGRRFLLQILPPEPEDFNPVIWLELSIRDVYEYLISHALTDRDFVGLTIRSASFSHGPAVLSFRPVDNFFYEDLWTLVSNLTQSNDSFEIDDSFVIDATFVEIGTGRRKKYISIDSVKQRSLVSIAIIFAYPERSWWVKLMYFCEITRAN